MFTSCIFCNRRFEENESLEHLRHGSRVAFDPARGRLWTLCRSCRGWTLAPIERRWEALEELERLITDRGRLLAETDNVALLDAADLEIVRVGKANLREEAWWRYGREFERRRKQHQVLSYAGYAGFGALALTGTLSAVGGGLAWYWGMRAAGRLPELGRFFRFGRTAWRGSTACPVCGERLTEIPFRERDKLVLAPATLDPDTGHDPAEGSGPIMLFHCSTCVGRSWGKGRFEISGLAGEALLRRVLAYQNFAGGSDEDLRQATAMIEELGSTRGLTEHQASRHTSLGQLARRRSLALEIALNEESERRMLQMELAELEVRWKAAEEIAAIADDELTPVAGFRRLIGAERRG